MGKISKKPKLGDLLKEIVASNEVLYFQITFVRSHNTFAKERREERGIEKKEGRKRKGRSGQWQIMG